jgi:hypothetical protein
VFPFLRRTLFQDPGGSVSNAVSSCAFGYQLICLVIRWPVDTPNYTARIYLEPCSYALCASQLCCTNTPRVSAKYDKSAFRPATSVKYIPSGWLFFQFQTVHRSEIRETLYSLLSLPRIPNPTPFRPPFIQLRGMIQQLMLPAVCSRITFYPDLYSVPTSDIRVPSNS